MKRAPILSLALCLIVMSAGFAGSPTNRFILAFSGKYLAVRDSRLVLGSSTFGSVSDNRDASDRWNVLGTQIKSNVRGGYLAYPPASTSKHFGFHLSPAILGLAGQLLRAVKASLLALETP